MFIFYLKFLGSSAYNPTSLQRQRELDTSNSPFLTKLKLDDRPTLSMSSTVMRGPSVSSGVKDTQSRYNNPGTQSSYSRSNSIVNMNSSSNYKSSNSMKFNQNDQNDYSNNGSSSNLRHDDPPEIIIPRQNRRDSTG